MRSFLLPLSTLVWLGCSDTQVVVLKADAGTDDAAAPATDAGRKGPVLPDGTETDAGIVGRRFGDFGCESDEDCDSSVCFISASASTQGNFCTKRCTPGNAKTICAEPGLLGSCSRQGYCDLAP